MTSLAYIAGYGRSGSTVLGTLLGALPDAVHVGEIAFFYEDAADPARTCSCGESYAQCAFWSSAVHSPPEHRRIATLLRRVERVWGLPAIVSGGPGPWQAEVYRDVQERLLGHVRRMSGASLIIDSSKSAWSAIGRFAALERLTSERVTVIHLVRSGEATLRSIVATGSNWALEGKRPPPRAPALRATLGWTGVNVLVPRLARMLGPVRYVPVRYEDLLEEPVTVLTHLGRALGRDPESVIRGIEEGREFSVGHVVGGNRLRFEQSVRLARPEPAPLRRPESSGRALFHVVGGWLENRWYPDGESP